MARRDMEDGFVLVVPQLEVVPRLGEVIVYHVNVVLRDGVEEWQVAHVVGCVGAGADRLYDVGAFVEADDVFDSLTFVVLSAAGFEEFVVPCKPIKDLLVTITRAWEQRILSQMVFHLQSFPLILGEDVQHSLILCHS